MSRWLVAAAALASLGLAACGSPSGSEPAAVPPASAAPTTTPPVGAPTTATTTQPVPAPASAPATSAPAATDVSTDVEPAERTIWNGVLPAGGVPVSATASAPVALRIPDLGVDAPIVPAGTEAADGGLELPDDTTTVAWFRDGARPGASGSAVLAAHVDHGGREGVFFALAQLPAGSTVEIGFADGSTERFVTTAAAEQLPKASLPIDDVFRRGGPPVVTLVTCGGPFDRAARSYEDNTIVTAVPA